MKATTFTNESTALQSVIALAEKALELITSPMLNCQKAQQLARQEGLLS